MKDLDIVIGNHSKIEVEKLIKLLENNNYKKTYIHIDTENRTCNVRMKK